MAGAVLNGNRADDKCLSALRERASGGIAFAIGLLAAQLDEAFLHIELPEDDDPRDTNAELAINGRVRALLTA